MALLFFVAGVAVGAELPAPPLPLGVDLSQPLTLADCVSVALALSPTLAIAGNQVQQAQAGVIGARGALLPNLTVSSQVTMGAGGLGGGGAGRSSRTTIGSDTGVSLTQTFFQSGVNEQIRSAQVSVEGAKDSQEDTRLSLILTVAQNYYTTLASQGLAEVARGAVTNSTQHLDAVNARISAGTAAASDRYPFEVELQQALVQAISAGRTADTALLNLKQVMGLPAESKLSLAEALSRPPLPEGVEALKQSAMQTRPDLQRSRRQVEVSRLSLRVAQIERGPVLNAGGSEGYSWRDGDGANAWQLQVGVSLPVFDLGQVRASQESAQAGLEIAQQNLRQAELLAGSEIESNLLAVRESYARIDAAEAALTAAQVALEAAQGRYQAGLATVIDVTDAELKFRQAGADRVAALYDYNTSLAALWTSLGSPAVPGAQTATPAGTTPPASQSITPAPAAGPEGNPQ